MLAKRSVVAGVLGLAVFMAYGFVPHGGRQAAGGPTVRSETAQANRSTKEQPMFDSYDLKARNPYGAKLTSRLINPGGSFTAMSIAIPAGQQLADHTSPKPAVLLVIEGQATLSSVSGQIDLLPGGVVHIPSDIAHRIDATTNSHFVLVR